MTLFFAHGVGMGGFGCYLLSAAALLVAYQRMGKQVHEIFIYFCASTVQFSRIIALSGSTFGFHTRGSGRRVCRRFCLSSLIAQSSLSGGGVVKSASLYTRQRRFWYACQRIDRTSTSEVLFVFFGCSILSECVCGEVSVSLHSAGGFGMHARGSGG